MTLPLAIVASIAACTVSGITAFCPNAYRTCCSNGRKVTPQKPEQKKAIPLPKAPAPASRPAAPMPPVRQVAVKPAAITAAVTASILAARPHHPEVDVDEDMPSSAFATMKFNDLTAMKMIAYDSQPNDRTWKSQYRAGVRNYFMNTLQVSANDYSIIAHCSVDLARYVYTVMRASLEKSEAEFVKEFQKLIIDYVKTAQTLLITSKVEQETAIRLIKALSAFRGTFGGPLSHDEPVAVVVDRAVIAPPAPQAVPVEAATSPKKSRRNGINGMNGLHVSFAEVPGVATRTRSRAVRA